MLSCRIWKKILFRKPEKFETVSSKAKEDAEKKSDCDRVPKANRIL